MLRISETTRHAVATLAIMLCCMAQVPTAAYSAQPRAAVSPLAIDLDQFERMKKQVALGNGITLAYLEFGAPGGPPVVLIHGYTDNARDWVPLVPFLAQDRHLVLVDIRGHGASSKPECCYTRVDFAYDIKLLLDRLGIRRADLVGHSLGSIIAQTFAEYWPDRTRRVVLISSSGALGQHARPPAEPPAFNYRADIVKLTDPIDPESPFMLEWYGSPTPVDPDFLRRERRDAAAIPASVWLAVLDQGLTGIDLQGTLPWLAAPALLIWGAKDPIFGVEDRRSLSAALPRARVVVFPDLGHNPFWEDPRRVASEINAFLGD